MNDVDFDKAAFPARVVTPGSRIDAHSMHLDDNELADTQDLID